MTAGPLAGLAVLDLTRLLPGGYCTLMFSDLGADVVKVEEPGRGDYIRWTPPLVDDVSAAHLALNRGKRSVTLNLKHPEGPVVLRRLAERFDVLVESFRPGVMDRLGVGREVLAAVNPGLVFCSITGYGQDGPYRSRAGHDLNYIGYSGALGVTGEEDGPPVIPSLQMGDLGGGGMAAAIGVLAALWERHRTGRGRLVDTAMLDGVVSWLSIHAGASFATGEDPGRGSMPLAGGYACYRVYRCSDGEYLTVAALEPQFWRVVCERLGVPDLEHEQFAPPPRQRAMAAKLQEVFGTRTRAQWLAELEEADACVGPVNGFEEAFSDPQIRHRGMIAEVDGRPVGVASPFVFDGGRTIVSSPAPGLGEHTDEVLEWVGLPQADIERLRRSGVV